MKVNYLSMWSRSGKGRYLIIFFLLGSACASFPDVEHRPYEFPEKNVFVKEPPPKTKKFKKLGVVRSKVNFETLDPSLDTDRLCKNYYNKSVNQLLKYAKKAGGDAVIEVQTIVFMMDGKMETYDHAECADDGLEAQVLTRGVAIKYLE